VNLFSQTWQLIKHNRLLLAQLLSCVYGPFYLAYGITVAAGWLPADNADKVFGLIGVALMPVTNGVLVWLAERWYEGRPATLSEAMKAMPTYWSRMLTVYVAISFVILGWLLITVLPVFILMQVTHFDQPVLLVPIAAGAVAYAMSRFVFVDTLIVNGARGPYQARQESAALGVGQRGRTFAYTALTYTLPSILELGGDLAAAVLPAKNVDLIALLSTGTGLLAACLYVVPSLFFYVYYRSLLSGKLSTSATSQGAELA